ncbi:lipoprotein [bacterium]|nr:lipoprotein [bacterium]MDB4004340.1 lipoprotein [Gammaproteobacteria bacterium]MDC1532986.1 lipoprotein [bacterium]
MPALNRQRPKTRLSGTLQPGTLQRDIGHVRVAVLACVLMALLGCGQKGGLTRPESNPTPSAQFQ